MSEKQKYIDFEAYERVAEPHKREWVSAWRTAPTDYTRKHSSTSHIIPIQSSNS